MKIDGTGLLNGRANAASFESFRSREAIIVHDCASSASRKFPLSLCAPTLSNNVNIYAMVRSDTTRRSLNSQHVFALLAGWLPLEHADDDVSILDESLRTARATCVSYARIICLTHSCVHSRIRRHCTDYTDICTYIYSLKSSILNISLVFDDTKKYLKKKLHCSREQWWWQSFFFKIILSEI